MQKSKSAVLQIIYFALMASLVIYGYLAFTLPQPSNQSEMPYDGINPIQEPTLDLVKTFEILLNDPTMLLFLSQCFLFLMAGIFIPRLLIKKIQKDLFSQKMTFDMDIQKLTIPIIVRAALFEGSALIGFVAAVSQKTPLIYVVFAAPAFLCFILFFPTTHRLESLLNGEPTRAMKASTARL